jgi:surface protein
MPGNSTIFTPQTTVELKRALLQRLAGSRTAQSYGQIATWNVTAITDMSDLFHLSDDDSSTVPASFYVGIEFWDVSNVENMSGMFLGAANFNQPIGRHWDVSNVTDMSGMFMGAASFNQPLNEWNVGNVVRMDCMFSYATHFNQPLDEWNVENVETMERMFMSAAAFNQPIGAWDVGNVEDMAEMFKYATAFNQPIGEWDVERVTDMSEMFSYATNFNQPIGEWDVERVRDMNLMFAQARAFNQRLSWRNLDPGMFIGATAYNANSANNSSRTANRGRRFEGVDILREVRQQPHTQLRPRPPQQAQLRPRPPQPSGPAQQRQRLSSPPRSQESESLPPVPLSPINPPSRGPEVLANLTEEVYNNAPPTLLETKTASISRLEEGYDIINGPTPIAAYLSNNIAIKSGNSYVLTSKTDVYSQIVLEPRNIKYECRKTTAELGGRFLLENIDRNVPYISIASLGAQTSGVIYLSQLKSVLLNPAINAFEIDTSNPVKKLASTASLYFILTGAGVGASHCQEGQDANVYTIRQLNLAFDAQGGTRRHRPRHRHRHRHRPRRTHKRRRSSRQQQRRTHKRRYK